MVELKGIYNSESGYAMDCDNYWKVQVHTTKLIYISYAWVWASDTHGAEVAQFNFGIGLRIWNKQSLSNFNIRVLPVRGGK
ncbi:hypothetical protein QUF75_14410 [Desulfococcaceae bacterium HSG7]|nr:hypothetical protein [Desulfococcaceae bacterium HSG7]